MTTFDNAADVRRIMAAIAKDFETQTGTLTSVAVLATFAAAIEKLAEEVQKLQEQGGRA